MINKPKYIENLEDKTESLSTMEIGFNGKQIQEFLDSRNFVTVWSKGFLTSDENRISFNEKIYKTKQGFFLYLYLDVELSTIIIYYRQEQLNELTIFISQLLKQFKNATINIRGN